MHLYKSIFKRVLDLSLAILLLLALSPLMLLVGLAILISMGRPVLFFQERAGYREKPFTLAKFRTMRGYMDINSIPTISDTTRVTKLGQVLRKYSLDELPNLYNVLVGDMSFIGPRPLPRRYSDYYTAQEKQRFEVRPGITGLAQVNGRNKINWDEKFRYDCEYVNNLSFLFDCKLVLDTIFTLLRPSNVLIDGEALEPALDVVRQRPADS